MANSPTERDLLRAIMLAVSQIGARLFRNNVGNSWVGSKYIKLPNGDLLIKNPRPLKFGLHVGSSDLIGWTPIRITAEMAGRQVAVFTAIEGKTARLQPTPAQSTFLETVRRAGGISLIGREVEAVRDEIGAWWP